MLVASVVPLRDICQLQDSSSSLVILAYMYFLLYTECNSLRQKKERKIFSSLFAKITFGAHLL